MTYDEAAELIKRAKFNLDRLRTLVAFSDKRENNEIKDATAEWLCLADFQTARALASMTDKKAPEIDYREKLIYATRMAFDRGQITEKEFRAIVEALGVLPL